MQLLKIIVCSIMGPFTLIWVLDKLMTLYADAKLRLSKASLSSTRRSKHSAYHREHSAWGDRLGDLGTSENFGARSRLRTLWVQWCFSKSRSCCRADEMSFTRVDGWKSDWNNFNQNDCMQYRKFQLLFNEDIWLHYITLMHSKGAIFNHKAIYINSFRQFKQSLTSDNLAP